MNSLDELENTYETINGYQTAKEGTASPAAQTFTAPRNSYLSAVDLYFNSKGSTNRPITMEIRNTGDNGQPGTIVYSETSVNFQDVQTTGPTEFKFEDPVLLIAGHKYAIVLYTASLDYQLQVSVRNHLLSPNNPEANDLQDMSYNPNGKVQGSFWYSINGTDWSMGDPTGSLGANAGGLCLKFDIKEAHFVQDQEINFKNIVPSHYRYNYLAKGANHTYKGNGVNSHMNGISYLTFDPNELTPFSTSIDWYYSTNNGRNWQNLPLNYTIPINLSAYSNSDIQVRAILHGSPEISPLIEKGSLHFAVQRTISDPDNDTNKDLELGIGQNQFNPNVDDQVNSGEYVSRAVVFATPTDSDDNKFNQIYASFEERSGATMPTDLYVNLNPDSNPRNNFRNKWIQMTGYDEYTYYIDKNEDKHTTYMIVDPRTGTPYALDPTSNDPVNAIKGTEPNPGKFTSHRYSEPVENVEQQNVSESTWVRYHFHVSINRLFENKANLYPHESNNTTDDLPKANEVKFKLVFHAANQYDHPMVRKLQTTVNKDDEKESPGMGLN